MSIIKIEVKTHGEKFYNITEEVKRYVSQICANHSGILHLFVTHTSCALTINESYDPSARIDLENFLKHLAPRNLSLITHTDEGEDDSPSHMKSLLCHQNLAFIVEKGQLLLGTWQGIYLAEFRDDPKTRIVLVKFQKD
ncbi:secondary thiamine-phosphate synthase enzyme [Bacteriovorax sp. BSW11_IV]|uniref:secondary thiamine-phosphate synthase enzyme YjbQ n=1 Tax=Bacteriovorax sp. BSW11_IV TaxID=1353529 RepID=UPI00038A4B60|nr:secondary thiamine-phosphate synthase enzyme YjbQ [Bacteriovorax sp. BSW11_IV]EQC46429.1 secondary thiamine-phosphate synthase enzyme [Bacteriovorax sp. BSW11_IV]